MTLWHKCNWEKWLEDANRQQESWILSSISKGNYCYYYYSYYYWTAFLQDCILINICNAPWFEKSMFKFVSSGNGLTATINPWNTRDVSCGHHQSLGFRKKQLYPLISWSLDLLISLGLLNNMARNEGCHGSKAWAQLEFKYCWTIKHYHKIQNHVYVNNGCENLGWAHLEHHFAEIATFKWSLLFLSYLSISKRYKIIWYDIHSMWCFLFTPKYSSC